MELNEREKTLVIAAIRFLNQDGSYFYKHANERETFRQLLDKLTTQE